MLMRTPTSPQQADNRQNASKKPIRQLKSWLALLAHRTGHCSHGAVWRSYQRQPALLQPGVVWSCVYAWAASHVHAADAIRSPGVDCTDLPLLLGTCIRSWLDRGMAYLISDQRGQHYRADTGSGLDGAEQGMNENFVARSFPSDHQLCTAVDNLGYCS
ncbi:hypothetical protein LshimejAT787_1103270 [Lyophyllum shimeji]|uniref:Uncharacterized protein n=1 Tax=Lyophyllum shimeji TaxID=47721 RepID=A0A9P3URJ9_LYOSH|nr:hypothetical protein LshimejAT787_1103270 [Lyophyllum shimeji]